MQHPFPSHHVLPSRTKLNHLRDTLIDFHSSALYQLLGSDGRFTKQMNVDLINKLSNFVYYDN